MHGLALRVMRREDLVAQSTRIKNWSQIVPYLTSFARFADRSLQNDVVTHLAKPHRLERLEAWFNPIDPAHVRAALFASLAAGRVVAAELDRKPLSLATVFRQAQR